MSGSSQPDTVTSVVIIAPPAANDISLESCINDEAGSFSSTHDPVTRQLSTFHHRKLPNELWLEIFRYATYVPRPRDLTVVDPFAPERLPNFAWGVNNPVLSLRTKCTLVRVCKAWRMIAIELLYEHIVVASMHRAKLIIRTFQESAVFAKAMVNQLSAEQTRSDNRTVLLRDPPFVTSLTQILPKGHGQWVRHLEIRSCTRNTSKLPFLRLVGVILSFCTSLHVLNGVWTIPVPKEFLAIIQHYHGKTLRGLGWEQTDKAFKSSVRNVTADATGDPTGSGSDAILSPKFLPTFQQLRVLDLRTLPKSAIMAQYNSDFGNTEEPDVARPVSASALPTGFQVPTPVMSLPHVTTLRLPSTPALLTYASKIFLPALRDLLLDASNVSPYYMSSPTIPASHHVTTLTTSLLLFLTVHGPSLTSLELVPSVSSGYKPSPYPLSPGLFLQPGVCPNLVRLVYDCRERGMVYPVSLSAVRGLKKKTHDELKMEPPPKPVMPQTSPFPSSTPEPKDLSYLLTSTKSTDLLTHPHRSLRLIAIRGLGISRLYPNRPTHTQAHLLSLLSARLSGNLPALETVRTAGFLVDTSADGLARDIFIWWTERFEYIDVDLVDGEGVMWVYEDEKPESKEKGKETAKAEEQGDTDLGINTEAQQDAGSQNDVQAEKAGRDNEDTESTSKVNEDGSPKEIYYVGADCPTYVHKNDPVELAAKHASRVEVPQDEHD